MEECIFIFKTFYQTSSYVTVQRQFQRKFIRLQAPAGSAIVHLVQKVELTGSGCDNKGMVGKHRSVHTRDNVACVLKALLLILK
jgi:hypothetical protein